ncbi:glycosyltransferase family 4 protein [Streptomyces sp. JJ38]|nr:glycosyltransferase family 4 protein [Streptomyces sp. JJ38]
MPWRTVQVLGGDSLGTGVHVRSLAAGLAARGVRVTVCAPRGAERCYRFTSVGAHFAPLSVRHRAQAVALLRSVSADADLVHAHGMRAGLLASLALRGRRRVPLVVSWHTRGDSGGVAAPLTRLLERRVVRAARLVLGATPELVAAAREHGARDARLAPVALPALTPEGGAEETARDKARAELGALDRPLVVAVGRLVSDRGLDALLAAAAAWGRRARRAAPPLVALVGAGPEQAAVQRRVHGEGLPVALLGRREDALTLLAAADVAVLSGRRPGRSLLAQEALRSGVPLVATRTGGLAELVGDAALLVPYGDAEALTEAVEALLTEPELRERLTAAGREQAGRWPTEDATVAHVLSVYDELAGAVSDW